MAEEEFNKDFAALGLDREDAASDDGAKAASEVDRAPVYRSVSSMLTDDQYVDPVVYRSLKVTESCPSVFDLADFKKTAAVPKEQGAYYTFDLAQKTQHQQTAGVKRQRQVHRVQSLRRPFAKYVPAPVHALAEVASGDALIEATFAALHKAQVDASAWDESLSSISCKVVVDSTAYRFDVYILELDEAGKVETSAAYMIEIQRISSCACPAAWSAVVDSIMSPLADICFGGYFTAPVRRPAFGLTRQSSSGHITSREDIFADLGSAEDDEIDLESVDEESLVREYTSLVGIACNAETPSWCARVEVAQLLARVSAEERAAKALIKADAVPKVIQSLQAQVLSRTLGELACAFCTLLSNLAVHFDALETPVSVDLAAHTTMHVLRAGDLTSHLDIELLREAARALSLFSRNIKNKHPLLDQVREVANTCAMQTNDTRLSSHVTSILRNTTIAN
ncbi:Hypothetical Protein FCC1311_033282 [Hondaea fermentalgiana]|uniref:Uncharacterized protein n=1 Tax=Hondaea fermentalgiana TaxID=2315210 RepID=A0A2R5G989_9STRA|nr:Hypothetical Protein FCC1311_033282 [Hondaea fermentalgiana]|eukprot:GBG27105.1 Hypothetical Protein FCC1311_033282 [Hondaea fermentalgiana]